MTTEELLEFLWQQAVSVGYDKGREAFDSMESESFEELKAKLRAAEDGQAQVQNAAVDLAEKLRAAEEEMAGLRADVANALADLASMTAERDLALEWEKRELGEARSNLQIARADAANLRAALAACAAGPWIKGKPVVMDGRDVLVSGPVGPYVTKARAEFATTTEFHAELRPVPKEGS